MKAFNTQSYSRAVEFIYIGNEHTEEDLNNFLESNIGESVGGYNYAYNDEAAFKLREELKVDCVPVVIVLD